MSSKKHDDTEGVPVRLDGAPDHRADGVPVAIPESASDEAPKPARKRAAKRAAKKAAPAATPTGQSAEPNEES